MQRFYRVRFADAKVLGEWTMRVLEILASSADAAVSRPRVRPVIFVPLRVPRRGTVYGYVSESARGFARGITRGVDLREPAVSLAELPDGLTLLHGDGADREAYEYRTARAAK